MIVGRTRQDGFVAMLLTLKGALTPFARLSADNGFYRFGICVAAVWY